MNNTENIPGAGDGPRDFVHSLAEQDEFVDRLAELAASGRREAVRQRLQELHPADVAVVLAHLPFDTARTVFHWLPAEQAGEVLPELDDHYRARLLAGDTPQDIVPLLDELDTDDAADVLADLPEAVAEQVLPDLEDAIEVAKLLHYGEESAGGLMATELVTLARSWSVTRATQELRRATERIGDALDVFVVDELRRLEGSVSLKTLLLAAADAVIGDIMNREVVAVPAGTDQEEVARLMERYDLVTLPVVDEAQRLLGHITIDDVVDVIREEAEEDIQLMSGVTGGEEPTDSIWRMVGGRLPWLLGGLAGAGLAAMVVGSFEAALQQAVILAGFIPIVMATAGNVGIQSSSVAVQGLAAGDVWAGDIAARLGKELLVAMINGVAAAAVVGLCILALSSIAEIQAPGRLALTGGLALIAVIILAALIGTTVPLLLHRFGVDPALATGPFITTSNDILSVFIFFTLASALYLS
jgi:magnesium transporter